MDIVKLSYKEYKYNGEDAVYWFNDLGTLV
jgi:hypothetical protein